MRENEMNVSGATDGEVLDGIRSRLSGVEPLVPVPPAWGPEGVGRAASDQDGRARIHVRAAGAVGFGGVIAVALVAAIVAMSWASGGPRSMGAKSQVPTDARQWTTIVYELQPVNGAQPTSSDLDTTVRILKNRIASTGIAESAVTAQAPNQVTVSVPGPVELASLRQLSQTGSFEFVLLPPETYGTFDTPGPKAVPAPGDNIDPGLPAQFTGDELDPSACDAQADPSDPGHYVVDFGFKTTAATDFETWTGAHVNDYFAIVLDGKVFEAPYIKSVVMGGAGQIGGNLTAASAQMLATILKSGQLPFPLTEISYAVTTSGAAAQPTPTAIYPAPVASPSVKTPTDLPPSGRTLGAPNAPVPLDIWVDYGCAACRDFAEQTLPKLIDDFGRPGKVKITYHDLIVIDSRETGRTESLDAANASRCAADQGKFWVYQDWLFANQSPTESTGWFTRDRLEQMAQKAGLDMAAFEPCLVGGRHNAEVLAESQASTAIGVPAFYVNGREVTAGSGAVPTDELHAAIAAALGVSIPTASATAPSATAPAPTPVKSTASTAAPSATAPSTAASTAAASTAAPSTAAPVPTPVKSTASATAPSATAPVPTPVKSAASATAPSTAAPVPTPVKSATP